MEPNGVPQKKELKLSFRDKVELVRSNRYFLAIFPFAMLIAIIVIFGMATGGRFFKPRVLKGIFNQAMIIGTCATGVAFIYANGNLDISIGAALGLSGALGVLAYGATQNVVILIAVTMLAAAALLVFNCTMAVVCHIKTITVAIVVMQIYSAIQTLLVGGAGKIEIPYETSQLLLNGGFHITSFVIYFAVCLIIFHMTKVGRSLRFLGGNENCSRQTGINNAKMTYISFLVTGIGVGLAAVYSIIDVAAVSVETGSGLGMDVMLATVLGGMSIFGGHRSNAYAGILGAIMVATLNKGLLMVGVSAAIIQGVRGVIFLTLVYLNSERQNLLPSRVQF